jgi:hypothetical protein
LPDTEIWIKATVRYEKEIDEIVEILVAEGFFESMKGNIAEFLYQLPTDMPRLVVRNEFSCPLFLSVTSRSNA